MNKTGIAILVSDKKVANVIAKELWLLAVTKRDLKMTLDFRLVLQQSLDD